MNPETKNRLLQFLLDYKNKNELVKLCKEKGLKRSGIKQDLIDRIIASSPYEEILELTQDVPLWTTIPKAKKIIEDVGEITFNQFLKQTNRYKIRLKKLRANPLSRITSSSRAQIHRVQYVQLFLAPIYA